MKVVRKEWISTAWKTSISFWLYYMCVPPRASVRMHMHRQRCFIYPVWRPTSARPAATTVPHRPLRYVWACWQISCGEQHLQKENQSNPRGGGQYGSQRTYSMMCEWALESWVIAMLSLLHLLSFSWLFLQAHKKVLILRMNLRKYCTVPLWVSVLRRSEAH